MTILRKIATRHRWFQERSKGLTLCVTVILQPSISNQFDIPMRVNRRSIAGSAIGGIAETQESLDFCEEKGIAADVEIIDIQQLNEACERLLQSDVKYRFVIDMASLKAS